MKAVIIAFTTIIATTMVNAAVVQGSTILSRRAPGDVYCRIDQIAPQVVIHVFCCTNSRTKCGACYRPDVSKGTC